MKKVSYKEFEYIVKLEIAGANLLTGTNISDSIFSGVQIIRINSGFREMNDPAIFGVNWSALGTKTPEETESFAYELQQAAEVAKALTDMKLVCDRSMSSEEFKNRMSEKVIAGDVNSYELDALERMNII